MDKGTIGFFAAAPIENIDGVSDSIIATYAVADGKITFRVTMTSFVFKRSLMKEHFNDKYIESQKYPVASFTGTVQRTESDTLNAEVRGGMTIHGVTRQVKTIGTLTQNDEGFTVFAQFVVMLEDYEVEPPRLFWKDITDQVLVTVEGEFRKGG